MKIQFSSLSYLQNWKTRFIHFILIPLINLCLLVLIDAQYTNSFSWSVAVATVVLSGGTLSMSSMAQLFVMDRNLKIDKEMVVSRPYSVNYWSTKILTSTLAGLILIMINLIILFFFKAPFELLVRAVFMTPLIVISGVIVGFVAAIGAWQKGNPYFYVNIVSSLATIVAGTLVLVDHYPQWMRLISYVFPFSQTIRYVVIGKGDVYLDILIDFLWLVLGIICYKIQIKRILRHPIQLW